ncbi:MAG: DUF4214 domain-containing protein [Actinomycetota bacterium]|nr:DUF4214 domain-containing protein [Actinomycetota bacterium]
MFTFDSGKTPTPVLSDKDLDLTQHGFQDLQVTDSPSGLIFKLTTLMFTDPNAMTLQFIDGTYTVGLMAKTGSLSLDGNATEVARLYHTMLGRDPEFAGEAGWKSILASGQATPLDIANGFSGSMEFQTHYAQLNNNDFVSQLYQNVLGRPGDPGGQAFWVWRLDNGATRAEVGLGFSDSGEDVDHLATPTTNPEPGTSTSYVPISPAGIHFYGSMAYSGAPDHLA